jgi:hypothetical protein
VPVCEVLFTIAYFKEEKVLTVVTAAHENYFMLQSPVENLSSRPASQEISRLLVNTENLAN